MAALPGTSDTHLVWRHCLCQEPAALTWMWQQRPCQEVTARTDPLPRRLEGPGRVVNVPAEPLPPPGASPGRGTGDRTHLSSAAGRVTPVSARTCGRHGGSGARPARSGATPSLGLPTASGMWDPRHGRTLSLGQSLPKPCPGTPAKALPVTGAGNGGARAGSSAAPRRWLHVGGVPCFFFPSFLLGSPPPFPSPGAGEGREAASRPRPPWERLPTAPLEPRPRNRVDPGPGSQPGTARQEPGKSRSGPSESSPGCHPFFAGGRGRPGPVPKALPQIPRRGSPLGQDLLEWDCSARPSLSRLSRGFPHAFTWVSERAGGCS